MAVEVVKIDSNVTGLRYAEEDPGNALGPLGHLFRATADPPTDNYSVWEPLEPNSYSDFGGQISTVARNPINPSRQRKKGVTTDLDASGGINSDWTQTNMQDPLQGFFFADMRRKGDFLDENHVKDGQGGYGSLISFTTVGTLIDVSNLYVATVAVAAGGSGYAVGDLVTIDGGTNTTLAMLRVTAVSAGVVTALSIIKHGSYSVAPSTTGAATSTVTGGGSSLTVDNTTASFADWAVNDLAWVQGAGVAANNGLHVVTAVTNNTSLAATGITDEAAVPAGATLTRVGHQGASGDLNVDASSGTWPQITSTTLDFTNLGIVPGEWIHVGGDGGSLDFATAANNGWKRIRSVAANAIEIDKSDAAMVDETGTGLTVQIFVGRVLKNETGTLIKRRTYTLERTLGVPNPAAAPTEVQAEYLRGSVPNEITVNIPQADKLNIDLSWVSTKHEPILGATPLWSEHAGASALALIESDAFNTSSDFSRIKLATVVEGTVAPDALFAFATELSVTINNNVTANKAVGVLGAIDATVGTFEVGGNMTAYFSDNAAVASVQNNADITLDIVMAKANAGISIDMPLITLGDGRANVEQDAAITLPLETAAATGAKNNPAGDHTLLMGFYDYLPDAADV